MIVAATTPKRIPAENIGLQGPGHLHSASIEMPTIVQNVATLGTTEVSFTIDSDDLAETLRAAEQAAQAIGASGVAHEAGVAKVSVVGLTQIVWGMAFDALLWQHSFGWMKLVGIVLVVAPTSWLLLRR